jgi:hypothetical protein
MSKPAIHGITISVEVGDKEYGNGQSAYMNLQARYPETGKPIEELGDTVVDGLDLYFAAWKSILAGRSATGIIKGPEFKTQLETVTTRVNKVREFLKNA